MKGSCIVSIGNYFNAYLLPIRALFFFQTGATACIIPYLPLFIEHLGLNAAEMGTIYGILTFLNMLSKPVAGILIDKFSAPTVIRIFTVIELVFMSSLYFIPKMDTPIIDPADYTFNVSCSSRAEYELLQKAGNKTCHFSMFQGTKKTVIVLNHSSSMNLEDATPPALSCNCSMTPIHAAGPYLVRWSFQLWLTSLLLICAWIGYGSIFTLVDAAAFPIVESSPVPTTYGSNRVFGTFGYASFALLMALLLDEFSSTLSAERDLTLNFVMFVAAVCCALTVTFFLRSTAAVLSKKKRGVAIKSRTPVWDLLTPEVVLFWVGSFIVGICTGMLYGYLFWYQSELGASNLLLGLTLFIDCAYEAPMMACSGWVIRKLGYHSCMVLALLSYGVRFVAYHMLQNPWWFMLTEVTHATTFGLFYATMNSFAYEKAPVGASGTLQGLIGATYDGFGQGIGLMSAGFIYQKYGGPVTWLSYGLLAIVAGVLYFICAVVLWRKKRASNSIDAESIDSVHLH